MSHRLAPITRPILLCVVFLWLVGPALAENAVPLADIRIGRWAGGEDRDNQVRFPRQQRL